MRSERERKRNRHRRLNGNNGGKIKKKNNNNNNKKDTSKYARTYLHNDIDRARERARRTYKLVTKCSFHTRNNILYQIYSKKQNNRKKIMSTKMYELNSNGIDEVAMCICFHISSIIDRLSALLFKTRKNKMKTKKKSWNKNRLRTYCC